MRTVEYRAQIEQALQTRFPNREFLRQLNYRSLWFFPHVLTTVLAAWAITRTELLAFKLAESLIIGSSFASLGFLSHEFLHGSIVKRRWLGGLMGGICMAPFAVSPTVWRWWHNDQHHGHTQVYKLDPDASARIEEYQGAPGIARLDSAHRNQRIGLTALGILVSLPSFTAPLLVISDGASGLKPAVRKVFPKALMQRCQVHKLRNILCKSPAGSFGLPKDVQEVMKKKVRRVFTATSDFATAVRWGKELIAEYGDLYPSAMECFAKDLEACLPLRVGERRQHRVAGADHRSRHRRQA